MNDQNLTDSENRQDLDLQEKTNLLIKELVKLRNFIITKTNVEKVVANRLRKNQ